MTETILSNGCKVQVFPNGRVQVIDPADETSYSLQLPVPGWGHTEIPVED
jgi:hypothetical protein